MGGRKPTFLLGRLECTGHRHCLGSLRLDLEKIREAAERVARSEGLEIFDVEWKVGKQRFLRVIIDRPPRVGAAMSDSAGQILPPSEAREGTGGELGISHADCQRVSQQLSVILDVEELIPGPGYTLEVSSPGLDRALRRPAEYERFRGRMAKISTTEPVDEMKYFEGRLAGITEGKVRLELKGKVARTVELPLEKIRKANLMVEF
jgi:ribosome maturation factor RimP